MYTCTYEYGRMYVCMYVCSKPYLQRRAQDEGRVLREPRLVETPCEKRDALCLSHQSLSEVIKLERREKRERRENRDMEERENGQRERQRQNYSKSGQIIMSCLRTERHEV